MPLEKSAGAVVFRKDEGKNFYLLLHYQSGARRPRPYWDFPKGHVEKGENLEETVKREVEEETGLKDIEFIKGFKEHIKYFFKFKGKNIFKIATFFLVETRTEEVKISWEHIGHKWLSYEEAIARLNFKNAKEILKKAKAFLEN